MIFTYYTDGAATMKRDDNGNYLRCGGGWAFVRTENDKVLYYESGGSHSTTNNEQELTAINRAIKDFNTLKKDGDKLSIYSDSAYSINIFTSWAYGWEKNGWTRGKKKEKIENLEIIKETFNLIKNLKGGNSIEFIKVKGHSNNEFNILADKLAVESKIKYKE